MILWAVIAVLIIIADQVAKYLVVQNIGAYDIVNVIPKVLEFVYVKNTGAAFSILDNMTWLLGLISVAFCVLAVIFVMKKQPKDKMLMLSISMLFGGAMGNGIDRIFRGFVVDFIETAFIDFPVFNIADVAITGGAIILIIYIIKKDAEEMKNKEKKDA